jgi:hypothetical protein
MGTKIPPSGAPELDPGSVSGRKCSCRCCLTLNEGRGMYSNMLRPRTFEVFSLDLGFCFIGSIPDYLEDGADTRGRYRKPTRQLDEVMVAAAESRSRNLPHSNLQVAAAAVDGILDGHDGLGLSSSFINWKNNTGLMESLRRRNDHDCG